MIPGNKVTPSDAGTQEQPSTEEGALMGQYLVALHTLEIHNDHCGFPICFCFSHPAYR